MNCAATRALRLTTRQRLSTRLVQTRALQPAHPATRLAAARGLHSSLVALSQPQPDLDLVRKRFSKFDVAGKVFIVTGGAQGLGLTLAEALVEAGAKGTSFIFFYI